MGLNLDFLFLTINNQGFYLALELVQKGYKVGWLDLSERCSWTSLDFSGPLPFHMSRNVDEKDHQLFLTHAEADKVPQGLCLMTQDKVLELKGEISHHQIVRFQQHEDLYRLQNLYSKNFSVTSKKLKDHWLLYFFSAFNKSLLQDESPSPQQNIQSSDVFADTYYPVENYAHRQKCRKHLEAQGVSMVDAQQVEIRFEGSQFFIKSGDSVSSAKKVLSFIESSDLQKVDPEFSSQVFVKKPQECAWQWFRFNLNWQTDLSLEGVPDGFLLLPHWDLPWLEENFLVLRKSRDGNWSLWVRTKKLDEPYQSLIPSLQRVLQDHLGMSEFQISMPEKNPGLNLQIYPIYERDEPILIKKNVSYYPMGFDKYESFDRFDNFQNRKQFVDQLLRSEV